MAKKTYSDKLKDPRWQKLRLLIMERDGWRCKICGDEKSTLNVHHLSYHGNPWETPADQLITYCEYCHAIVEWYKKQNLIFKPYSLQKNALTNGDIQLIMLYTNDEEEEYIDVFHWKDGDLIYKSSISYWVIHRIDHFFKLINEEFSDG